MEDKTKLERANLLKGCDAKLLAYVPDSLVKFIFTFWKLISKITKQISIIIIMLITISSMLTRNFVFVLINYTVVYKNLYGCV